MINHHLLHGEASNRASYAETRDSPSCGDCFRNLKVQHARHEPSVERVYVLLNEIEGLGSTLLH
jgi:hypothetical protein